MRRAGFVRREALVLEVFAEEGQVRFDFASRVALGLARAEEIRQPGKESAQGYAPSASSFSTSPEVRRQRAVSLASAFSPAFVMA